MQGEASNGDVSAEATFDAMAPIYDDFTAHHDFEGWLQILLAQLERHGLRKGRLLDVACGTGRSFLSMLERGWEVTGCDISTSMLDIARDKAGDAAHLSVADIRELPAFGQFELVWALGDVFNYLRGDEEMEMALIGMRRNLAPHGLLLFDLSTLLLFRTIYAESLTINHGGLRMAWTGMTPNASRGSTCRGRLEVVKAAGARAAEPHFHYQRHFPESETREAMARAGLECLDVFGHHYDAVPKWPLDEAVHTKAIYIARAARAA